MKYDTPFIGYVNKEFIFLSFSIDFSFSIEYNEIKETVLNDLIWKAGA